MKTAKIGKFHILELIISGFMDFCMYPLKTETYQIKLNQLWYKNYSYCRNNIIML